MSEATTVQSPAGGLARFLEEHRTLVSYPTGAYRWALLLLTLLGTVLCYFDLGFAGLLPLWMSALHFSAKDFAVFLTYSVVLSGIAGLFSGPLADRHGRV